jgi:hypothetical protein
MIWRDWINLGGSVQGTPSLAGWTNRTLIVAARGPSGTVLVGSRDDNGWSGSWQSLGLPITDQPAVASVAGTLCVFARGPLDHLWVVSGMGAQDLGGILVSSPSVAQWRLDRSAHVFVRGTDNAVWYLRWTPESVGPWRSIGGSITGSPAAVAWGPDRLDVFGRGRTGLQLEHCWWDGNTWSAWENLGGGMLNSFPSAVSRDIGTLDVYYGDDSDQLAVRSFNGAEWLPARALGPGPQHTPSAFSFGPKHVEVLDWSSSTGTLRRIYGEGVRPYDDPAGRVGTMLTSAPSSFAAATTSIHCFARGSDDHLRHIAYDDGYWGEWEDLGDGLTGDPVAVSPFFGTLDVAVCRQGNEIFRRRYRNGAWSEWIDTVGQTDHAMAAIVHNSESRILVRGTNDALWEGVVAADDSWRWWRSLGGVMRSPPHVARVLADALPKPANALGPAVGIPAGTYLCTLGTDGRTYAQRWGTADWEGWTPFADGSARIARPLHVTWPLGLPFVHQGYPVAEGSQAGWFGHTVTGDEQSYVLWWGEHISSGYVSFVSLDSSGWQTHPLSTVPPIATHPVGISMLEPFDEGLPPTVPTMWAFGRKPDGLLMFTGLSTLAPVGKIDWRFFGAPAQGDPALVVMWERFEDAELLHVASIDTNGALQVRSGGHQPQPARIQPSPSMSIDHLIGHLHPLNELPG